MPRAAASEAPLTGGTRLKHEFLLCVTAKVLSGYTWKTAVSPDYCFEAHFSSPIRRKVEEEAGLRVQFRLLCQDLASLLVFLSLSSIKKVFSSKNF